MTSTATPEQEVWLLKHHVWNLFDDGLSPEEVTAALVADGRQPQIADVFVERHPAMVAATIHTDERRSEVVESVRAAVREGDEEKIRSAMEPACDDDRTLFEVFMALSWLLYDPPPNCQWAAFGLSKMWGYGDFALVQALQHDEEFNRYVAAFGLGTMGAEAVNTLAALQAALQDPSELVRSAAADAIAKIQQAAQQQ